MFRNLSDTARRQWKEQDTSNKVIPSRKVCLRNKTSSLLITRYERNLFPCKGRIKINYH